MKYTLSKAIESRAEAVRIGRMAETWCRNHMGLNNKKQVALIVSYYKADDDDTDMGEYRFWDNEIVIYYNNCHTVKDLIQTLIHEWQHQLQPLTSRWKEYESTYYSRNPFEREAYAAEKKHYSNLWKSIKNKLNK